jgi:hypothetical protein
MLVTEAFSCRKIFGLGDKGYFIKSTQLRVHGAETRVRKWNLEEENKWRTIKMTPVYK